MTQNAGAVVEKAVRRSGMSIAELARRIGINRRSIYNWFEQDSLSIDTIYKIGNALDYDFSADFPDVFASHSLKPRTMAEIENHQSEESLNFWKNKYITLLEKYNELLSTQKQKPKAVSKEESAA